MIPLLLDHEIGWQSRAACISHDPELWYADNSDIQSRSEALRICRECPVQTACLDDAIEKQDKHGIRGATTPAQRARLTPKTITAYTQPGLCQGCDRRLVPRPTWRKTPPAERDWTHAAERHNGTTCNSCARRKTA